MLNKQATRFLNRKWVKNFLSEKILTAQHITRLNKLFAIYTCKQLEDMHPTIAKFVLYDLTNYVGRLRRLRGISGTNKYTQLLRYGKDKCMDIYQQQSASKTAHFLNKLSYWISKGYTPDAALIEVKRVQQERNAISVEKVKGTSMYSCRSSAFWINKGLNEIEAAEKVKDIQSTNGIVFYVTKYGEVEGRRLYTDRINRWQKTLDSKSTEEKADINLRKSPSIIGRMARGDSLEEATIGYLEFCKKMKSKTNQTWSKISQELFVRLDEQLTGTTYYQSKNYEYNIDNYRVDFYHKDSKTVVEFYGDFFHRNPAIFEATFNVMGYASEQKWKSDSVRIEEILMSALVNRVIIVWEYDFRIDPTSIVDGIVKQIGE